MGANWLGPWVVGGRKVGRVREVNGRPVWVIERMVAGVRRTVTLRVPDERSALAELALFERSPAGYRTPEQATASKPGGCRLDAATISEFVASKTGETKEYREHILGKYLAAWSEVLRGRDLSGVNLGELQRLLARWPTARRHRIVALKSFTTWLREHDRLRLAEDPTAELRVPQPRAERSVRAKGYSTVDVERTYSALSSQALRDVIRLRACTGMHDTEIARIARGEAQLRDVNDPCGIAGTITFRHLKAGKVHVISVDAATLAAAKRLAARRAPLTRAPALLMLKRAHRRLAGDACTCEQGECSASPPIIRPSELRHSFATWARKGGRVVNTAAGGVPLAEIASVLGHSTPRTTAVFYEGNEVPPMVVVPVDLRHKDDPPVTSPEVQPSRRREPRRRTSR